VNTNQSGNYNFSDNPLADPNAFKSSEGFKLMTSKKRDFKPTFKGPYG
jgi:hypothetical protein